MNYTKWAKIIRMLGWLNVGVLILELTVIVAGLLANVYVPFLVYGCAIMGLVCAKMCFTVATRTEEMAKLIEEDNDEK